MVELSVLGGVVLRRDGHLVRGRPAQRHHVAILALLAASPGSSASREKLIGHLWPESDSARARHRLSVALHVLRRGLGDDLLATSGDMVSLNPEVMSTDLGAFLDALEEGKLEEAVGLYAGPFLDGFFLPDAIEYEPWMETERVRLAGLYRAALERLITEAEGTADLGRAVTWRRRLASHDRYSSSVTMGLMRALAAVGDVAGAVRHARAFATLVEGELEVPPNPEVLKLADELVREGRAKGHATPEKPVEVNARTSSPPPPSPVPPQLVVHPESPLPEAAKPDLEPGSRRLLDRRVAGWSAVAALLALGVVGIVSRGAGAGASSDSGVTVLTFTNESGAPELTELGERLAEQVGANLAYVPDLSVRVETTTSSAGDPPRPVWLVDASLSQEGSRTVVAARLVDARAGETLWSEEYERLTRDVQRHPEEVSLAIADDLRPLVAPYVPRVYTENRRAYDRFLMAVYAMRRNTPEDLWQALQFHREAWEEDPDFALAHAIAGNAYLSLAGRGVSPEIAYDNAREHVLTALALDSTLAEGHAALGNIQVWWDRNFEAGERSLRRAIMSYPTLPQARTWYGFYLLYVRGFPVEAIRQVRLALEVDPLNTGRSRDVESILYRARRYDEVEAQSRVTWSLDPEIAGFFTGSPLAQAYRELGRYNDAIAEYRAVQERTGSLPAFGLALTYARMGRREEARAILRDRTARAVEAGSAPLGIARVHASLDEPDSSFAWLQRTLAVSPQVMLQLTTEPSFDPVRSDPRFDQLLITLGLEPHGDGGEPLFAAAEAPGEAGPN